MLILAIFPPQVAGSLSQPTMRISKADYEAQAKDHTARELEKLRQFLATQRGARYVTAMRNGDSELKMRRFVGGGNHVDNNARADDSDEERNCGKWFKFW